MSYVLRPCTELVPLSCLLPGDTHSAATWRQQAAEHEELYKSQRQVANASAFHSCNIGRRQTFEVCQSFNAIACR